MANLLLGSFMFGLGAANLLLFYWDIGGSPNLSLMASILCYLSAGILFGEWWLRD